MRHMNTKWKLLIASGWVASVALLIGCDSQSTGNEQTAPEAENSTDDTADVKIDAPGFDLELNRNKDSAEVDVDVPDDEKSNAIDIDVNSPE